MKQQRTIIEADVLRLKDNEGRIRILLDGGRNDGVASIVLFSADEKRSVSIMSQPDNRVEISLRGVGGVSHLTLLMDHDDEPSITLSDAEGRFGIILGVSPVSGKSRSQIMLFRDGQVCSKIPQDNG